MSRQVGSSTDGIAVSAALRSASGCADVINLSPVCIEMSELGDAARVDSAADHAR